MADHLPVVEIVIGRHHLKTALHALEGMEREATRKANRKGRRAGPTPTKGGPPAAIAAHNAAAAIRAALAQTRPASQRSAIDRTFGRLRRQSSDIEAPAESEAE